MIFFKLCYPKALSVSKKPVSILDSRLHQSRLCAYRRAVKLTISSGCLPRELKMDCPYYVCVRVLLVQPWGSFDHRSGPQTFQISLLSSQNSHQNCLLWQKEVDLNLNSVIDLISKSFCKPLAGKRRICLSLSSESLFILQYCKVRI